MMLVLLLLAGIFSISPGEKESIEERAEGSGVWSGIMETVVLVLVLA
jgi:hypothetical protein